MNHLFAVLGLGVACALWFVVQRLAGGEEEAPCDRCEEPGCDRRVDRQSQAWKR